MLSRKVDECKPLHAGDDDVSARAHGHHLLNPHLLHGRMVQVDPTKTKLKAPGTHLLTLKCGAPLSTFAFKVNLRRYITERGEYFSDLDLYSRKTDISCGASALEAGAYTRSLFSST